MSDDMSSANRSDASRQLEHRNRILKAIRDVNQLITHTSDKDRLLQKTCECLTKTRGFYNVWIALFRRDDVCTACYESGLGPLFVPMKERLEKGHLTACCEAVLHKQKFKTIDNPHESCTDCDFAASYSGRGAMTVRIAHAGNTYGIINVSVSQVYVKDPEERQLLMEVANDIGFALYSIDQQQQQQAARNELRMHRQITGSLPQPMAFVDAQYRYQAVNEVYSELFGVTPGEIVNRSVADFLGEEAFTNKIKPHIDRCLSGEKVTYRIHTLFPKVGRRWMEMHYVPYRDEAGRVTGMVVHGQDITDLLTREMEYIRILETTGDGFWVISKQQEVLDVNQAAADMLGYSREELIGLCVSDIDVYETREDAKQRTERMIAEKGGLFEARHRRKDETIIDVEVRVTYLDDQDGRFFVFVRDISERKMQERITALTLRIQAKLMQEGESARQLKAVIEDIHNTMGLEATGIRLWDGLDYPYYETRGFPEDFVEAERYLCAQDENGEVVLGESGHPVLECMCGNVIRGRFDPSLPFFTVFGTFWTNSTTGLLASTTEADRQARTRNRCNGEGYESVALIPLPGHDGNIGLIQFNDSRRNCFTPSFIQACESLAAAIGNGIERFMVMEKLRSEKELSDQIINNGPIGIVIVDCQGRISFANKHAEQIFSLEPSALHSRKYNDPQWKITTLDHVPYPEEKLPFNLVMKSNRAVFNIRHAIEWSDGNRRLLSINGAPLHDEKGRIERVVFAIQDITKQHGQARDLALQAHLLNQSADAVYAADENGRFIYINRASCSMTGYSREELLNMSVWDIAPEFVPENYHALKQQLNHAGVLHFPTMHCRKDGTTFPTEVAVTSCQVDGQYIMCGLARDITEQTKRELALKRTQFAVDTAPFSIFWMAPDGQFVYVNDRAAESLGYTKEELLQLSVADVDPHFPGQKRKPYIDECRGKGGVQFESVHRRKDGTTFPVQITSKYIEFGGEELEIAEVEDISERKAAEQALRERERDLHKSQSLAQVGSWHFDLDTGQVFASEEGRSIYGLEGDDLMIDEVQRIPLPEYRNPLDKALKDLVNKRSPYDIEFQIRRPTDGEIRYIHSVAEYDPEKNKVFGAIQDVTQQREMEQQVRQMEKMDAIGKLAGGIAHDFNNQLTTIIGYADMLQEEPAREDIELYARQILIASRRAADLTSKLLAFAHKGQFQSVPVDIHVILHEITNILSHSIDKRIVVKKDLHAAPATTLGDPGQIQNALLNLAINAADAMPEGGVITFGTSVVTLDAEYCESLPYRIDPGHYLEMNITDTGTGIPPECIGHIYEPFFTTKETGKGTGLGLAAVYGTVKNHGGAINVYSEVGHGTTFRLYLPLENRQAEQQQIPEEQIHLSQQEATILVVDDEESICKMTKNILSSIGYQVVTFCDPNQAIAYYRKHWQDIDLVILDLIMPDLNGQQVYRAMREYNTNIKVLLASGYSMNEDAQKLLDQGVQGFVQKPYARPALSAKVAALLYGLDSKEGYSHEKDSKP
jgi:PAS domain S-box-containing protein